MLLSPVLGNLKSTVIAFSRRLPGPLLPLIVVAICIAACSLTTDTSGLSGGAEATKGVAPADDAGSDSNAASFRDASDASDALGSMATKVSIACGSSVCQGAFVCCMKSPSELSCALNCPTGTIVIRCDDVTDCAAGNSCCAVGWASPTPGDVSCVPGACSGAKDAALCIAGQPDTCAPSLNCRADMTSTGYAFHSCQ